MKTENSITNAIVRPNETQSCRTLTLPVINLAHRNHCLVFGSYNFPSSVALNMFYEKIIFWKRAERLFTTATRSLNTSCSETTYIVDIHVCYLINQMLNVPIFGRQIRQNLVALGKKGSQASSSAPW